MRNARRESFRILYIAAFIGWFMIFLQKGYIKRFVYFIYDTNFKTVDLESIDIFNECHFDKTKEEFNFDLPKILSEQEAKINDALVNYNRVEVKTIHNVIITTWLSGSPVLRKLITLNPLTFYHYEPLMDFEETYQIRDFKISKAALGNMQKLFNCNYTDMEHYLNYGKYNSSLIWCLNPGLWEKCQTFPQLCYQSIYIAEFCKLYPIQSMEVHTMRLKFVEELFQDDSEFIFTDTDTITESIPKTITQTEIIEYNVNAILNKERFKLLQTMNGYLHRTGTRLSDFSLETYGTPFRNIILTIFGSNSTFLEDLINLEPPAFYHHEQLINSDLLRLRIQDNTKYVIKYIKDLMQCKFIDEYLINGQYNYSEVFLHNTRLRQKYQLYGDQCWNADFVERFCKLFPSQTIKLVRLDLKLAFEILKEDSLNVKIVYLVRDPRGTLESRKLLDWCKENPECTDASTLCKDLTSDYYAAINLLKRYPNRFKIVRYEELALYPYKMSEEILQFYGLPFHDAAKEYIKLQEEKNNKNTYSKYRLSKLPAFEWMNKISEPEIKEIEMSCADAMDLWRYKISNGTVLDENFNPILSFRNLLDILQ